MNSQVFRSRIDPLFAVLLFVPILGVCGLVLQKTLRSGQPVSVTALVTIALSLGFVVWIFAATSYRFTESQLLVQSGPFRTRVPVEKIRRVTRTRTVVSAPALSLQRLEITYDKGSTVVISPKDEAGFLAVLKTNAPDAELPSGA